MNLQDALHSIKVAKLHSAIEKNAAAWQSFIGAVTKDPGALIGGALVAAGGAAAITAASQAATWGVGALRDRIGKGRAYKGMIGASSGLGKRKDADKVQMTFNTLWNLNKDLAKDPLTAGSFVERSVQRADIGDTSGSYVDIETARNLLRSQARKESPIADAFSAGALTRLGPSKAKDFYEESKLERFKTQLRSASDKGKSIEDVTSPFSERK